MIAILASYGKIVWTFTVFSYVMLPSFSTLEAVQKLAISLKKGGG